MSQAKVYRLGDLQLKILKALWSHPDATVAEVQSSIDGGSGLAYTTIATMLRKMEARHLVSHREEGRSFVYRACVGEAEVSRRLTDHLVDRLFEGSLSDAVSHLLTTREVSREELRQLEKVIAEHKKKL